MINYTSIKELRQKTNVSIMNCKKALIKTQGDVIKAINLLRTEGLIETTYNNKLSTNGITAIKILNQTGAIIEVNSETDFVAKNNQFQQLINQILESALYCNNLEELKSSKILSTNNTIQNEILYYSSIMKENLSIKRFQKINIINGIISSYVHNTVTQNQGQISVLVGLKSDTDNKTAILDLGHKIAIHIAAYNPKSLSIFDLDKSILEEEKSILNTQLNNSNKPKNIIEKILEGKINKFISEAVLLNQKFLFNEKITIQETINNTIQKIGSNIEIIKFIRYKVGENIR